MQKLFSEGLVDTELTAAFALAVMVGTAAWVGLATVLNLPVSTTHALLGSLIGTALVVDSGAILWGAVGFKMVVPLLASVVVSYVLCSLLSALFRGRREAQLNSMVAPVPNLSVYKERTLAGLHWFSAGSVGAARGLNDTPKLAAIGSIALLPAGFSSTSIILLVTVAMCAGGLFGAVRIARRLGEKVVTMDHTEGLRANLSTALLVGPGAVLGLPMSTTHVSTAAIAGVAGTKASRLNRSTLRDILIAWSVTPVIAGAIAAGSYVLTSF